MSNPSNRILTRDVMQGILAIAVTVMIAVMVFTGRAVPDPIWAGWGMIIGFFYGGMLKQNGADLHSLR